MPKILVISSMVVSGLILLIFLLDLVLQVPFKRPSILTESFFAVAAAIVIYLGFEMYREVA